MPSGSSTATAVTKRTSNAVPRGARYSKAVDEGPFETIYKVKTRFPDEAVNANCTMRRSKSSGLSVIINKIQADCVYANFVFLTPVTSDKPLACCVQRLTMCGSENFPPDFVSRVAREISGAYSGVTVYSDRTVYTLNAENDRGLIALLPPYLDALFLPTLSVNSFTKVIYSANTKGEPSGNMFKDLQEAEQSCQPNLQKVESSIYPETIPYRYKPEGSLQGLCQVTLAEVRLFHQEYYRPSNCFIILGGKVSETDVLTVLDSFEAHLPEAMLRHSINRPCSCVAPQKAPALIHSSVESVLANYPTHQVKLELAREPSARCGPLPVIRFRSVADDYSPVAPNAKVGLGPSQSLLSSAAERNACRDEQLFDLFLIHQGPDFLHHECWTAFSLIARHIRNTYNEHFSVQASSLLGIEEEKSMSPARTLDSNNSPRPASPLEAENSRSYKGFEATSLAFFERKWPLAIFCCRYLAADQVEPTQQQFKELIERLTMRGDSFCVTDERHLHKLLASGEQDYQEQLQWRAEYDVVVSLSLWSASTTVGAKGTKECFECCVHPANDFHRIRGMTPKWWEAFIQTQFHSPIAIVLPSETEESQVEGLLGHSRKSSRWTLSSHQSEISLGDEGAAGGAIMEHHWDEKDEQVELYLESIGGRQNCQAFIDVDDDNGKTSSFSNSPVKHCLLKNGDIYVGPVQEDGTPGGGNGVILYREGSAFVGSLKNGLRNGRGTFIHDATDVQYDGSWRDDYWDGEGSLYSIHDRTVLRGWWRRGELVEKGTRIDLNTGLTWTEEYEDGCLVSQMMMDFVQSSDESPPSDLSDPDRTWKQCARHLSSTNLSPSFSSKNEQYIAGSESFFQYCKAKARAVKKHGKKKSGNSRWAGDSTSPMAGDSTSPVVGDSTSLIGAGSRSPKAGEEILSWDNDNVVEWLKTVFPNELIIQAFRRKNVDGAQLLFGLDKVSLKKYLNIVPFGLRVRLMEKIHTLRRTTLDSNLDMAACLPLDSDCCESRGRSTAQRGSDPRCTEGSSKNDPNLRILIENFHIPFKELEFLELLGGDRSFFSATYKGRWFAKTVAIKVFTGRLKNGSAWMKYVSRLIRLKHPNLILILGVSERKPDLHCVVTEFASHRSLLDCLHGEHSAGIFESWKQRFAKPTESKSGSLLINKPAFLSNMGWFRGGCGRLLPVSSSKLKSFRSIGSSGCGVQAGSMMPLDQATESLLDDGQALLTVGKLKYPRTSALCTHVDGFLDLLIDCSPSLAEFCENMPKSREEPTHSQNGSAPPSSCSFLSNQHFLITITKGIILGCIYLDQSKVNHLNLKSSNVLLDEFFHIKLTDFGQLDLLEAFENFPLIHSPHLIVSGGSRSTDEKAKSIYCPRCGKGFELRNLREIRGGPPWVEATVKRQRRLNWVAPEVLRIPTRHMGGGSSADIYSVGLILWHTLKHQIPFSGLSPTHIRVAVGYAGLKPGGGSVIWSPLRKLISSCLEFDASLRPTLTDVWTALMNVNESASSTAEEALQAFMEGA